MTKLRAIAEVVKLVDTPDSKSGGGQPRVGSSPTLGTLFLMEAHR